MIDQDQVQRVIGRDAYGSDGEKIGRVGQVFLDDQTGRPDFATVNTGLFGMSESFVPLTEATLTDAGLSVPFTKDRIKDAPKVSPDDGHLSDEDERMLFEYYGLFYDGPAGRNGSDTGDTGGTGDVGGGAVGRDVSGPTTDEAMTRSEERLDVG